MKLTCPLAHESLTNSKAQVSLLLQCLCCGSGVAHILCAELQIPAVSVVLCTSYRELEKKKRCFSEALGGFLQPALGCDLVCVWEGDNLVAVAAMLFALGISCLL